MQDTHIQARIQQFRDDKSVYECPVVKEYIESGRGDKVDESTEGACTVSQVCMLGVKIRNMKMDFNT